jgi:hypothetical protein
MAESPRFRKLLQLLNEFEVEYLIVGWLCSHEIRRASLHERHEGTRCGSASPKNIYKNGYGTSNQRSS